ncbi:MAG: sulfotransferase family protein [Chloroflexota bacterium]
MRAWLDRMLKRSSQAALIEEVVVVSGLPRSGTSLMMQMLAAGGQQVLADSQRPADESNPRGYYEFAPVKRLGQAPADWLPQAVGRAVKVVSPLLVHLPPGFHYRVIFMQRDIEEILRSQQAMLAREGPVVDFDAARLRDEYRQHLAAVRSWLVDQPGVAHLEVAHRAVIQRPAAVARQVNAFLDAALDEQAMAAVVDPALYRERRAR